VRKAAIAVGVLAVLAAAVVGVADRNREAGRGDAPSVGSQTSTGRADPDTALRDSIERARERQARVDGLAERLSP
jgi:hypothetical protein